MFGASEWPEAGALLGAWNFIELNWKTLVFGQQGFVSCVGNLILAAAVSIREVMMGEGNGVASVIMLTFKKMPGPHADTAWAVVG